jgi:hypothetical protein
MTTINKSLCIKELKEFAETLFPKTDLHHYDDSLLSDLLSVQIRSLRNKKDQSSIITYKMLTEICIYYTKMKDIFDAKTVLISIRPNFWYLHVLTFLTDETDSELSWQSLLHNTEPLCPAYCSNSLDQQFYAGVLEIVLRRFSSVTFTVIKTDNKDCKGCHDGDNQIEKMEVKISSEKDDTQQKLFHRLANYYYYNDATEKGIVQAILYYQVPVPNYFQIAQCYRKLEKLLNKNYHRMIEEFMEKAEFNFEPDALEYIIERASIHEKIKLLEEWIDDIHKIDISLYSDQLFELTDPFDICEPVKNIASRIVKIAKRFYTYLQTLLKNEKDTKARIASKKTSLVLASFYSSKFYNDAVAYDEHINNLISN